MSNASTIVRELELRYEKLHKQVDNVLEFMWAIGPKDPRSGPFIAHRVRVMLGVEKEEKNWLKIRDSRAEEGA